MLELPRCRNCGYTIRDQQIHMDHRRCPGTIPDLLETIGWDKMNSYQEVILGEWPEDGVRFGLSYQPTCFRRGVWKLLVEVCGGEHHIDWGCFDEADQPMRYYHSEETAKSEAEAIARVLALGRLEHPE